MTEIRLVASRHSAFYSPLISMVAGGFLEREGKLTPFNLIATARYLTTA